VNCMLVLSMEVRRVSALHIAVLRAARWDNHNAADLTAS
jgi:hypothetical protein